MNKSQSGTDNQLTQRIAAGIPLCALCALCSMAVGSVGCGTAQQYLQRSVENAATSQLSSAVSPGEPAAAAAATTQPAGPTAPAGGGDAQTKLLVESQQAQVARQQLAHGYKLDLMGKPLEAGIFYAAYLQLSPNGADAPVVRARLQAIQAWAQGSAASVAPVAVVGGAVTSSAPAPGAAGQPAGTAQPAVAGQDAAAGLPPAAPVAGQPALPVAVNAAQIPAVSPDGGNATPSVVSPPGAAPPPPVYSAVWSQPASPVPGYGAPPPQQTAVADQGAVGASKPARKPDTRLRGFYMRVNTSVGTTTMSESSQETGEELFDASGPTYGFDFIIGGGGRWGALGGGMFYQVVSGTARSACPVDCYDVDVPDQFDFGGEVIGLLGSYDYHFGTPGTPGARAAAYGGVGALKAGNGEPTRLLLAGLGGGFDWPLVGDWGAGIEGRVMYLTGGGDGLNGPATHASGVLASVAVSVLFF